MKNETTISIREFARRLNLNEKTIRDSISKGKIKEGVIVENGKPRILFEIAKREIDSFAVGKIKPGKKSQDETKEAGYISYSEAIRKQAILKARLTELDVLEREGTLVNKADVNSQLFEFGQEYSNSLLTIPDRIVDTLLSFNGDRNKMHKLIYDSLWSELDKYRKYVI